MPNTYLTDAFIKHATCGARKDQDIYWDHPKDRYGTIRQGSIEGLGVRVTQSGKKAFVHAYRVNGKRRRVTLGTPANMNVASARMLVNQREQQLFVGENPDTPTRVELEQACVVSTVIDRYWEAKAGSWAPKYHNETAAILAPRLKRKPQKLTRRGSNREKQPAFETRFADTAMTAIKPLHIADYLSQFQSPSSYNAALGTVKSLFNWAIRMQIVDMRNPCDPLPKKKIFKRRRDYTPEQIQAIAKCVFQPEIPELIPVQGDGEQKRIDALRYGREHRAQQQMQEYRRFLGILFLTMARPSDVKNAKFEHFDLKQLVWHKHDTKGLKLSHSIHEHAFRSIPIHWKVAEMVQAQHHMHPHASYVFPSTTDPHQARDNFRKQLLKFKQLEPVPDYFQTYDIKRMMVSSVLVGQGVPREDVSHYIDHHGSLFSTIIYDIGMVDPLRPVVEKLGKILEI